MIQGIKQERAERVAAILEWLERTPVEKARRQVYGKLYRDRVVPSRKLASKTGLWYLVYLTKAEVEVIFSALRAKMAAAK